MKKRKVRKIAGSVILFLLAASLVFLLVKRKQPSFNPDFAFIPNLPSIEGSSTVVGGALGKNISRAKNYINTSFTETASSSANALIGELVDGVGSQVGNEVNKVKDAILSPMMEKIGYVPKDNSGSPSPTQPPCREPSP